MVSRLSALSFGLACGLMAAPALALDGPFSQSYPASSLVLVNLAGKVEVAVGGSGISVQISGRPDELQAITVGSNGSTVRIESNRHHRRIDGDAQDFAHFKIVVPRGADLTIDGVVGEAEIGDVGGRLKLNAGALDGRIGNVSTADLQLSGSGDLGLGDVASKLDLNISGSGSLDAGNVDSADIEIAGSGDVSLKDIRHGLSAKIAGSGDIGVASVNGPVTAEIAGSGDISISRGRADPLKVSIVGSGDFDFGGEAVNPDVSIYGSGGVRIGSYSGRLQSHGTGDLEIGR